MSDTPTACGPRDQLTATKQEMERARKEKLKFSEVEVKQDAGARILPLPESLLSP